MKRAPRYLVPQILDDLKRKMVFVAGPRQTGKTTMALSLIKTKRGYLNWDIRAHRNLILQDEWPEVPFLVLDEIHKFRKWRNLLKGLFDQYREKNENLSHWKRPPGLLPLRRRFASRTLPPAAPASSVCGGTQAKNPIGFSRSLEFGRVS